MILELTKGAALLLALCYLETFIRRYLSRDVLCQELSLGILYGTICVIGMMTPIKISEGVIFDARTVVIAIAAVFSGPVCSTVAAMIAITYRLWLGGAGDLIGVIIIFTSFAMGHLYRYGRTNYGWPVDALPLFLFGFILHTVCIGWFFFLPATSAAIVLNNVALPFILVFPPATVLLGWMVRDAQMQIEIADELRTTTEALRESELRFRAIFDHSPCGITLKDEKGTYLVVNKTFADWQNLDADEIIGKTLANVHPSDQLREITRIEEQVLLEERFVSGKSVREYTDGVKRDVNVTKLPVTLAGGDKRAILTILTDITEITKTEKELRRAYEDAVAANRSKSDFLARMSHEFRTPLNAILGFSDILRSSHMGHASVSRIKEYANDIHMSADMLLELVNDLLDIAAIENGRMQMDYEIVDVRAVLNECMRTLKCRINSKKISIAIQIPEKTATLWADRRALKQILLNLITNAIKFTPQSGSITISIKQSANETNFFVADNGTGIKAELLENLMKPDVVLASNTHVTQEGWGLGLSIVRGLTEMHGGEFKIESHIQQGTIVNVMIPNEQYVCA